MTVNSDHFPLHMEVKLQSAPIKKEKIEVLNFKDSLGQIVFKELTSNTSAFTDCVQNVHSKSDRAQNG